MANKKIAKQNIAVVVVGGNAVLKMFMTSPEKKLQQQHYRKAASAAVDGNCPRRVIPEGETVRFGKLVHFSSTHSLFVLSSSTFLAIHFNYNTPTD